MERNWVARVEKSLKRLANEKGDFSLKNKLKKIFRQTKYCKI